MAKKASNRVVAFNIPQTEHEVVRVQVDELPYFYDQLHRHPEIQVMMIEVGEGTLMAGDFVGRFQPGDIFVLGSNQPHVFRCDQAYYSKNKTTPVKSISLYFNEKYFGKELWNSNELSGMREFVSRSQLGIQLSGPSLEEARASIRNLGHSSGLEKIVGFFSLLKLLSENPIKTLSLQTLHLHDNEERRMNSIIEFTFRESRRVIYLDEVSTLANLTPAGFCRYFKLHTGKAYTRFLHEVRVSNACQLLILKDLSVQEVCYRSGFRNIANFNRIFLKLTGKKPLSFRKQLS